MLVPIEEQRKRIADAFQQQQMRRLAECIKDTTPVVVRYDPPKHVKRAPPERKAFYGGCGKPSNIVYKQRRCKTWSKK